MSELLKQKEPSLNVLMNIYSNNLSNYENT